MRKYTICNLFMNSQFGHGDTATTMFVLPTSGVGVQVYHLPMAHTKNDGAFWQCLPHFNSFINEVIYLLGNSLAAYSKNRTLLGSFESTGTFGKLVFRTWVVWRSKARCCYRVIKVYNIHCNLHNSLLALHSNSWYLPCWFTTKHACRYSYLVVES